MTIQDILNEYDSMKGERTAAELQKYLEDHLRNAEESGDKGVQIALNNELVGITRYSGDVKAAMRVCANVTDLMTELGLTRSREYAIALINMATTYRVYGLLDEAKRRYDEAKALMDELGLSDPLMGSLYNNNLALLYIDKQEYSRAKEHLMKALATVSEDSALTEDKKITLDNLALVNDRLGKRHLERCRDFYEAYGRPMIEKKFPDHADRIAAGLVGEGSECFGFEDDLSRDHDFELGFCLWLNAADHEAIGQQLQQEYAELVRRYGDSGSFPDNVHRRHGVFSVGDFYADLLHIPMELVNKFRGNRRDDVLTLKEWMSIEEMSLAAATNGSVFFEGDGSFSRIRKRILEYYPEDVWKARIAVKLHEFSQSGQYNYARMMARGDRVTAKICLGRALDSAMEILYLLNRKYAPYYKWRRKGLEAFGNTAGCREILDRLALLPDQSDAWKSGYNSYEVNYKDKVAAGIEELAGEILRLMKEQKLVSGDETFLESYVRQM
ncbi:MAG: DUF4037 domain-containing protein [Lachnospiraceae bacterium]|nr:DUF4037 domain-containing protein [Lachnospiraceae bacterium]